MNLCNAFGCALNVIFFPYVYGAGVSTVTLHCSLSFVHVLTVYSLAVSLYTAVYHVDSVAHVNSGVQFANVYHVLAV